MHPSMHPSLSDPVATFYRCVPRSWRNTGEPPDPLTCFASARFCQDVRLTLAPSASLLYVDVLTAGRTANGERWMAEEIRSALRVVRAGRTLLDKVPRADPESPSPICWSSTRPTSQSSSVRN